MVAVTRTAVGTATPDPVRKVITKMVTYLETLPVGTEVTYVDIHRATGVGVVNVKGYRSKIVLEAGVRGMSLGYRHGHGGGFIVRTQDTHIDDVITLGKRQGKYGVTFHTNGAKRWRILRDHADHATPEIQASTMAGVAMEEGLARFAEVANEMLQTTIDKAILAATPVPAPTITPAPITS